MKILLRYIGLIAFLLAVQQLSHATDTLVIGVYVNPPFVVKNIDGSYEGLSIELWENIAHAEGIDYRYVNLADQIGILKALEYENIDLTINPMDVNDIRAKKYDVTQPYFISSIGVAVPAIHRHAITVFLSNFFSKAFFQIILLLMFIIFVFGFFLWLAERQANRYQFRPGIKGIFDGLWWSAVTMTTVGYGDKAPKTLVGRTIAVIWMFTAVIIVSSFTASIASTLTLSSLRTEIRDAEDLRLIKNIATVGSSTGEDFLLEENIAISNLYSTPILALRALAKKENDVLLYDRTVLQYYINRLALTEKVRLLPLALKEHYQSFMLPKDHSFYDQINVGLIREIEKESWHELQRKYNVISGT